MSEDRVKHGSLAAALVAIMGDLPGIEKVRHEGGVTYKYRGIEEITVALAPILVKHGVVVAPSAEVVSVVELPHKGTKGDWTRTTLSVDYTIHQRNSEAQIYATCIGVGDDNADKGANKAMTQAFKYALLQVLLNLCTNAIKYNDKENGTILITATQNDSQYKFSVQDNGPGIAPANQARIFDLFSTLGTKDRFNNKGTGIGLSTVKRLVEKMNGTISIDSQTGKGSTFNFTFSK